MLDSVIPTIDLAKDSPERQAKLIKHALGSVGFFAVQNAGPSVEDVQAMFDHVGGIESLGLAIAYSGHSLKPSSNLIWLRRRSIWLDPAARDIRS